MVALAGGSADSGRGGKHDVVIGVLAHLVSPPGCGLGDGSKKRRKGQGSHTIKSAQELMLDGGACEALESNVVEAIKLKSFGVHSQLKVSRGRDIGEIPDLYLIFGDEVQRDALWDKVQGVIC